MKYLPYKIYKYLRSNEIDAPQMQGVNGYWRHLNKLQIERGEHREFVGGEWDAIGAMQLNFLKRQGLAEQDTFLDVGCGALRGGIHFIKFLAPGKYHGIDINRSLLDAGAVELSHACLEDKQATLLHDEHFRFFKFEKHFDKAIAVSLFTHLFFNHIGVCLREVSKVLKPDGKFFATYFEAPESVHTERLAQRDNVETHYDADPFHYSRDELAWLASQTGLSANFLGDWGHPRGQYMAVFTKHPS